MKVCPTSGLQPVLFEAGLEGLWTPRLVPRLGYCDYGCNACGQICPSGAIPPLDLASKREQVIGVAVVDRNRCWPWAEETPCIVCEEMCPTSPKAVWLETVPVTNRSGKSITLQRPSVTPDLCTGCGLCEKACILEEAAVKVLPISLAKGLLGRHYRLGWREKAKAGGSLVTPDREHRYNLPEGMEYDYEGPGLVPDAGDDSPFPVDPLQRLNRKGAP